MANRTTLKSYFETGDFPTQAQFAELIDSFLLATADETNAGELAAVLAQLGLDPRKTILTTLLPTADADRQAFVKAAFSAFTARIAPASASQTRTGATGFKPLTPSVLNSAKVTAALTPVSNVIPVNGDNWWRGLVEATGSVSIGEGLNIRNQPLTLMVTADGGDLNVTAHSSWTKGGWGDGITTIELDNGQSALFRLERFGDALICVFECIVGSVASIPFAATGGTITDSGGYRYYNFAASGTFSVTSGSRTDLEALIVGGGGSGGAFRAGGGAGGAVRVITGITADAATGSYAVTVGAGGGAVTGQAAGNNGGSSSVFGTTSLGGGGGSTTSGGSGNNGAAGGSGGGAGGSASGTPTGGTAGTGGNAGGNGSVSGTTSERRGGGGGGAAGVGTNATTSACGNGGAGSSYSWPTATYYGAGGGGGTSGTTGGSGGTGGGGAGGSSAGSGNGGNASGIGAGGGASGPSSTTSGTGAAGRVIIRHPI